MTGRRRRRGFLERTVEGLYEAMEHALHAEHSAGGGGLLQKLDARVKVAGLLSLILASVLATRLWVIAAIFALAVSLATLSLISIRMLAVRVWTGALAFTGAIAVSSNARWKACTKPWRGPCMRSARLAAADCCRGWTRG